MINMIKDSYDVVVVGGGPGGCSVAKNLAKLGHSVLLLEKRQEIGAPKRCGEGLSVASAEMIGDIPEKCIVQKIEGAKIYAPDGTSVLLDFGEKSCGYIVERKVFDKWLAYEASRAGATIVANSEVTDVLKEDNFVSGVKAKILGGEEVEIRAKVVVAADGVESTLARKVGLNTTTKLENMDSGFQYEMSSLNLEDDKKTILYFGNEIAPRGYCVTPSTEIITRNTLKPISDVKIGEEVLSLNGWVPAAAVSIRDYSGEVISITPFVLNNEAKLTPDHLVYVWNRKTGFVWKKAGKLIKGTGGKHRNGDYLLFPIPKEKNVRQLETKKYVNGMLHDGKIYPIGRNQSGAIFKYKYGIPNELVLTEELMEFFGYYVAEGGVNSNGIIISTTDKKLAQRIKNVGEKRFGVRACIRESKPRGRRKQCIQVTFPSKILRQLFKSLFKEGSHNKTFPRFFSRLDRDLKLSFLTGLFRGDGNKYKKVSKGYDNLNYTSTSKSLIYDLWMLLSTIGVIGTIGRTKKKNAYRLRIYGNQLNKLGKIFGTCTYGKMQNNISFIKNNFVFIGIRNLKREKYCGKVYDIQSGGSFCPGFVIHNCWIFPKGRDIANVGIGTGASKNGKSAKEYLDAFIENNPDIFADSSIIEVNCGGIPVGGFLKNMVLDGFVVVGDAAHQVNPIHGGGMKEATLAGEIAAKVIDGCINNGDVSKEALADYNDIWWYERGEKLKRVQKLREVVEKLSDNDLNMIAKALTGDVIVELSRGKKLFTLAKILMKKPRLIALARHLI